MRQKAGCLQVLMICIVALLLCDTQAVRAAEQSDLPETGVTAQQDKAVAPEEETAGKLLDSLKGLEDAEDADTFLDGLDHAANSLLDSEAGDSLKEIPILQDFFDWLTGLVEQVFGFLNDFINETLGQIM